MRMGAAKVPPPALGKANRGLAAGRGGAGASRQLLRDSVERNDNDARGLREKQGEERLLAEVIRQAAERFRGGAAHQQP